MRLAIIAEKPSLLDAFAPLLPEFFPQADFSRTPVFFPVFGWFVGTANRFRLPRGLKHHQLPFTSEPVYKPITSTAAGAQMGVRKLGGPHCSMVEAEADQALADADIVLALVDGYYGGAHLAYRFIIDMLGHFPAGRVIYPWIVDISDKGMRKSLSEMRPFDEFAMPIAMQGEIRRYFDFNYLCNALPLFGEAARSAGTLGNTIPSKYGLQLLYDARETGSLSDGQRVDRMAKWKGTGKHKPKAGEYFNGLASATSRAAILHELVNANYLQRQGSARRHTELSRNGAAFLDLIHPDCQDADLPFRIEKWSVLPVAEARSKIDRYIRTFFGKQKTFADQSRTQRYAA
ncbi:hypothetical protein G6L37_06520 [Agrobacterium rubi]|nr:hypothetical protein [Agrobacterium rubi]NTF25017.1 hypothetical protein [Agrobacterium rubi]